MKTYAVIPVKRFSSAKRRLAESIEPAELAALTEAMVRDTLSAVTRARRLDGTIVVTGEAVAWEAATKAGAELVEDPADPGHSAAALLGVSRAESLGADRALLLPADCPLLNADELDELLGRFELGSVAVVPDRHGTGTNGLLLAPPRAIEPAFGEGSRERHETLARRAGLPCSIERLRSLALDVDTPGDLVALRRSLALDPDAAPRTAIALGLAPARGAR